MISFSCFDLSRFVKVYLMKWPASLYRNMSIWACTRVLLLFNACRCPVVRGTFHHWSGGLCRLSLDAGAPGPTCETGSTPCRGHAQFAVHSHRSVAPTQHHQDTFLKAKECRSVKVFRIWFGKKKKPLQTFIFQHSVLPYKGQRTLSIASNTHLPQRRLLKTNTNTFNLPRQRDGQAISEKCLLSLIPSNCENVAEKKNLKIR